MERELPIITIDKHQFTVDGEKLELREVGDPETVIPFKNMHENESGYSFYYNKDLIKEDNCIFATVFTEFEIPDFVQIDPVGIAKRYGLTIDEVKGKTDFDIMVDQKAFDLRINKGMLPTINIAGHTFYVDLRMKMLRPKDDFLSNGIHFEEIDDYFSEERNAYLIPYNPKTHEFQEFDWEKCTAFPKDIIAIEFPFQKYLDPIGWNRLGGWNPKDELKHIGLKSHHQAKVIPWEQTELKDIIKENLKNLKIKPNTSKPSLKGRKR
ncbi:hypothetical protein [Chryseobacterium defluvii]|uniref:Uncharacterized protein n=1 Tax=Chryseobacterium defluvii TaxID=160396 RepID=A0A495SQ21_9FLAO|nr:hypothetical protein [Chryseobacterium defluvii]RKT01795.1 hypothetical protein BCF58_1020 [Chryseobacterium defluvii]